MHWFPAYAAGLFQILKVVAVCCTNPYPVMAALFPGGSRCTR